MWKIAVFRVGFSPARFILPHDPWWNSYRLKKGHNYCTSRYGWKWPACFFALKLVHGLRLLRGRGNPNPTVSCFSFMRFVQKNKSDLGVKKTLLLQWFRVCSWGNLTALGVLEDAGYGCLNMGYTYVHQSVAYSIVFLNLKKSATNA